MGLTGRFNNIREGLAGRFSKGGPWQDPGPSSESRQIVDMLQNKNVPSLQELEQASQEPQGVASAVPQQNEVASEQVMSSMNSEGGQTIDSGAGSQEERQRSTSDKESRESVIGDDEVGEDILSSLSAEGPEHVLGEESLNNLMVLDVYQLLERCKDMLSELESRHWHL